MYEGKYSVQEMDNDEDNIQVDKSGDLVVGDEAEEAEASGIGPNGLAVEYERKEKDLKRALAPSAPIDYTVALNESDQKYIELRLQGQRPTEAWRQICFEAGKKKPDGSIRVEASRKEKQLAPFILAAARNESMTDEQFKAWSRKQVEIAIQGQGRKEMGPLLAGIRWLSSDRDERKYGNIESLAKSLMKRCERLTELHGFLSEGMTKSVVLRSQGSAVDEETEEK